VLKKFEESKKKQMKKPIKNESDEKQEIIDKSNEDMLAEIRMQLRVFEISSSKLKTLEIMNVT
jgi:rRNA maturation protein Rpf1